jgi:hypothetical protein
VNKRAAHPRQIVEQHVGFVRTLRWRLGGFLGPATDGGREGGWKKRTRCRRGIPDLIDRQLASGNSTLGPPPQCRPERRSVRRGSKTLRGVATARNEAAAAQR